VPVIALLALIQYYMRCYQRQEMSYVTDGLSVVVARLCYTTVAYFSNVSRRSKMTPSAFICCRYWQVDPSDSQRWDAYLEGGRTGAPPPKLSKH